MKARKLKSGSWNVRVMVRGKSYSFTDPDRRRCLRRASEFAEQCREDVDNPRLADALESFVESRAADLSPATVRGYASIVRATRTRAPQIAQKRTFALTDRDVQALINPLQSPKTQRNYVNLIEKATGRKFSVHYRNKRPKEIQVPTALEVLGLVQIFRKTELVQPAQNISTIILSAVRTNFRAKPIKKRAERQSRPYDKRSYRINVLLAM